MKITKEGVKNIISGVVGAVTSVATNHVIGVLTAGLIPDGNSAKEIVQRVGIRLAKDGLSVAAGLGAMKETKDMMDAIEKIPEHSRRLAEKLEKKKEETA